MSRLLPPRFLMLAALLPVMPAQAAPDSVDGTFAASAGQIYRNSVNDFGSVASMCMQPDGKLLVGSNEMAINIGAPDNLQVPLVRFNPDGSVDNTFFADDNPNGEGEGIVFVGAGWPEIHTLGLQSNGKIIAGGVLTGMNDGSNNVVSRNLVRIHPDGGADPSFQTAGTQQWISGGINYVNHLIVEPDDKIVIAGGFRGVRNSNSDPFTQRQGIARLNANGSLDTGFALDVAQFGVFPALVPVANVIIYQVERDAAGRYYIVGEISGTGPAIQLFARLFPDGGRDFSFAPALPTARWNSVALDRQGRITVTGLVDSNPTVAHRVFADGSVDPSFTTPAGWGSAFAQPLAIDEGGRFFYRNGAQLRRILADGSIDSGFTATAEWVNWAITPSFNLALTAPDGSIYGGGFFDRANGTSGVKIVRFEGDPVAPGFMLDAATVSVPENAGTLYVGVNRVGSAGGAASVDIATAAGSALAGVDFTSVSGTLTWAAGETGRKFLAVPLIDNASADGDKTFTVDLTNATGAPVSGPASAAVTLLDDDAAPLITSQPVSLAVKTGGTAEFTVRISAAGPATFQWFRNGEIMPGETGITLRLSSVSDANAAGYTVTVTTAGGDVTSDPATLTIIPPAASPEPGFTLAGVTSPGLFRILDDGSMLVLDGSVSPGYTLRKLDASLAVDPTFTVTTTPESGYTAAVAYPTPIPLPGGKILVTGLFSHVNGVARKRLARLNSDGSVDETFVPFFNGAFTMNGFNATFNGLAGVAVGGSGTVYVLVRSSNQGNRLFRLLSDGAEDTTFSTAFNYGTNANFTALHELADGSILIGYTAGGIGGFERGIRRVLPNGTFDSGFPVFNTTNNVTGILPLDGSRFAAIHGNLLTIHNPENGSLLETHTFTGSLTSIQPYRGRLLLTGPTAFGGIPLPGLALFSLNGTVDDNFPGGSGPNANVSQAGIDAEGRILVTGPFTTWNGIATPGIARLIVDRPELGFSAASATIVENEGPLAIQLVRYGDAGGPASVRVTTAAGSATSPADFTAIDQVVSWAAGDVSPKTVNLALVDDADIEGDEYLTIQLSEAAGATVFNSPLAVTVRDDDSLPRITGHPGNVLAVNGQPASLSVTVTSPTTPGYQWFLDGQPISGATGATHNIASSSSASEGVYTVRIGNTYGAVWSQPARLTIVPPPGAIATGFTPLAANIFNNNILSLATAPDGGVYAGGAFTSVAGATTHNRVAKIKSNGSLDTGFNPPNISNGEVRTIAVQNDGKVLVGGTFTTVDSVTRNRIIRLDPDGTLDAGFSTAIGTAANGSVTAIIVEPDGNILIGGGVSSWNGTSIGNTGLLRISPTGTYLGSTNAITPTSSGVQDILPLPDGRMLISYDTTTGSHEKVRRLNAALTHDTSFVFGTGSNRRAENMALASDGNYLFAGNGGLFKVSVDGTSVTSWSGFQHYDVITQWNGKVLGGRAANLPRYLADGTADPAFLVTTQPNGNVSRFAARGDGKVWVGGAFTTYNGTTVNRLFLLNGDAIPVAVTRQPVATTIADPGSDVTLTVEASGLSAISYQWFRNGSPIGGATGPSLLLEDVTIANNGDYTCTVTNLQGEDTSDVAQVIVLDAPVILSQTTGPVEVLEGSGFNLSVNVVGAPTLSYQWRKDNVPLANGPGISGADTASLTVTNAPVSLSGSYTLVTGNLIDEATSAPVMVSVLENQAAMAQGFVPPGVAGIVRQVYPLPGGKVLIGGDFTSASDGSNTSGARLAVVNADGSIGPVAGLSADGSVYAIRDGGDGKILIAGNFNTVNGSIRRRVARLHSDFSLDESFDASSGFGQFGGLALDVALEASGTILVAGQFADFNADPAADFVVRLTATGAHDTSFTSGANSYVYRVLPQPDGGAIMLGWFNTWSGNASGGYVVRTDANGAGNTGFNYLPGALFAGDGADLGGGAFIAAGGFSGTLFKYNPDGSKDASFLSQGAANLPVTGFARDGAGRIVLGGNFANIAGAARAQLVRILPDGTRDDSFSIGSGLTGGGVEDLSIAADGSIWICGNFTNYNGTAVQRLVRLKGDGGAVSDPYAAFVAGLPENLRGENDDADGDGIANLIEFLFGTDPGLAGDAPAPLSTGSAESGASLNAAYGLSLDPAKSYRVVEVEIPAGLMGLNVDLQASRDLSFAGDAAATQVGVPTVNGNMQTRRYIITPAIEDAPGLFWRLSVSR